jgi:hypothetical protein
MDVEKAVEKGFEFLESQSDNGFYKCQISSNRTMENPKYSPNEIASASLILGTAFSQNNHSNQEIVDYLKKHLREDNSISFFENQKLLPTDADTTSYTLSSLIHAEAFPMNENQKIAKKIIENQKNNQIQVYFIPEEFNRENRFDEVALCNISYFLIQVGFEDEAEKQLPIIRDFFTSKKYLNGSRYYFSPETAIYFASRLIEFPKGNEQLHSTLENSLKERIGKTDFPLDLAMRVTSAYRLGLNNDADFQKLISIQNSDGSFPADAIYKYGSKEEYFGSKEISTAFSIEALMTADK